MSMHDTSRFGLPLLQAAQAQKHVTVNEALMRLDGLVNLVLQSATQATPPATIADGQCWAVPDGAAGDWTGHAGTIAIGSNGGWIFVPVVAGMRAFVADRGVEAICDGQRWIGGALNLGNLGSAMLTGMVEGEVDVAAGTTFETGIVIPDGVVVIGAIARVVEPITGTLAAWRLGNPGANNRFGSGLGLGQGSWARGLLGSPMAYYEPAQMIMTAEGGAFSGGKVRIAVHWFELRLPAA